MATQITDGERAAISLGISRFFPYARIENGELKSRRWSEVTDTRAITIHAVQSLPKPWVNGVSGRSHPTTPWNTEWSAAVTAAKHRADAMTALATELNQFLQALDEKNEIHAKTFDDLETWLARKVQALNENISNAEKIQLERFEEARERWIETLTDDNGEPWFRISDRVLDDLGALACSQGAALRVTATVPRLLAQSIGTIADPGRREVRTFRANQALTVPYIRVEVPRGQPLMLPCGDDENERIDGQSMPLHRALVKTIDARTLLWLMYEWIERPRDEHGEKLDYIELTATQILERWGFKTKGSPRKDFLESVERLAEFRVDGASAGGREQWVVAGPGENAPRLLQITKCEIDGKEVPNKPRRARFAAPIADALIDVTQAIQIRTNSLKENPSTVLVHMGLAGLIRERMTEVFKNMHATGEAAFALPSVDDFVRWCNRETRSLHDGMPMHFRALREVASAGYVQATVRPDGSVLCVVDELWLDVYRPFETAKQRHTVQNKLAKGRKPARKRSP